MGANSGIEWTHHTFNPWRGCVKVSEACRNCYAEVWAKRTGKPIWGAKAPREFAAERYWHDPVDWNADAIAADERRRVFCASLADVFEDRPDLVEPRRRLFGVIDATPGLDWLLLTKRPQNIRRLMPRNWRKMGWPKHVWAGTTVESQADAAARLKALVRVPARVRFISAEPLLGPLNLQAWLNSGEVDWLICGGESGTSPRPMRAEWARDLRDQCVAARVPFHFKQWGAHNADGARGTKKANGRVLDGRVWDEFPQALTAKEKP